MTTQIAIIIAGAFVGAVITGGAGFAFAIVATIVWVHVLTPPQTVMLAAACASTIHIASIWHFRKDIDYRRLWPFVLGSVFGAPLGVYALKFIRAEEFRLVVGAIIVAYSLFIAFRPKLHRIRLSDPAGKFADAAVGWTSGILGGALAPGVEVSLDALANRAAQLRSVELTRPPHAIGKNTVDCLRSGIVFGYVGLIEGLVRLLSSACRGIILPSRIGQARASIADRWPDAVQNFQAAYRAACRKKTDH